MLGLPRYHRGEEIKLSYTVEQINSWSILAKLTSMKNDLRSMTSGMHVHLLPIAQWVVSQCKRKTGRHDAIAKAAAICIFGAILFPSEDGSISFANLSIIDSISEALRRGELTRPGLVPIARRWDSRRDTRHLADQLEHLQEAIDSYPYLDVVWQPYLGEGDEGQPWLVQARPYFGRSVWLHALNLVLPLNLFLTQRSLGFRQSVVEFLVRDRFRRPGRSFRGLHDTTDWKERAREQVENWERKGKGVRSDATTDDAYLQAYTLKYGGKVYKSARHQVDVTSEIASLQALLQSAVQDREAAQRQTAELRRELERVRGAGAGGASSSRSAGGSPSLVEARLAGAVLRAEEAQRNLEEWERDLELAHEQAMTLQSERDQQRIRAEAAEAQVVEMTRELATLRVQRPPGDQEEVIRLRSELLAQQTLARSLQQIVTDIGRSRSRSRSGVSVSRATGASVGQYLAGSSSRRRNEEEERCRQGEGSAHEGRGGGEMLPPPERREGSGESGGGQ
ncbi:hypothetical protein Taro_056309 [Colocasia esculenta]|uniref:Uncharacterized protein n=1 Tax=Colocasia esculenta TaxID=4460 RepID=A0A843XWX3_COLES|nr:hypothetical protein [Colocasia esculenta]